MFRYGGSSVTGGCTLVSAFYHRTSDETHLSKGDPRVLAVSTYRHADLTMALHLHVLVTRTKSVCEEKKGEGNIPPSSEFLLSFCEHGHKEYVGLKPQ